MIQKITPNFTKFIVLFSLLFFAKSNFYAQTKTISPQVLPFDRICAGIDGNDYSATFTYTGFPVGTVFVVELSTNNFASVVSTTTLSVSDPAANQKTIRFAVPSNLTGSDTYSLRVSTTGFSSGKFVSFGLKNNFPIYYRAHDRQYTINNFSGSAAFCSGGSYLLTIDPDSTNPINDSPLKYPFLTYNWYRDNGVSVTPTLVAGATGPSYSVTTDGIYYVETNYGTCSSQSYSNRVTVTSSGSGSSVTISSSLGNPFCASAEGTVLTATSGNTYLWKKNGIVISGATTRSINATDSGVYTVDVDFGGCKSTGTIDLKSNGFNVSIDVADEFKLVENESKNVSVTTDATAPDYQWFLNGSEISGATTSSYLVSVIGNYKVKISQASGCIVTKELSFKVTGNSGNATVVPNIVSLANPYWNIPDVYKTAETKITILSSNGEIMFDDVGSNYDPQVNSFIKDFKNVNPVYYYVIKSDTGEKKGSITVIR